MQRGFGIIYILVGVLILGLVAGGAFYLDKYTSSQPTSVPYSPPSSTPSLPPLDKNLPVLNKSSDQTANWKTYKGFGFEFQYPQNWIVDAKYDDYIKGPNITLNNSSQKVALEITSPNAYPFGFSGPNNLANISNDLSISLNGKEYATKENILDNKTVYVTLDINEPKSIHIIFGVDYPTHSRGGTLVDYYKEKSNILQILSTFKLTSP